MISDRRGEIMAPAVVDFDSFQSSIPNALDAINAHEMIKQQNAVLIKPNLIADLPHPMTTSAQCCEAVIQYIQTHSRADIVIAEGCGDQDANTHEIFESLGYTDLSRKYDIPLVDLNEAPVTKTRNNACPVFPEMHLPKIAFTHYIISVPVLKAHSYATITGTLKNMMGFAPPKYYSGRGGFWKKAVFHENMQQSIIDLSRHLVPDLSIMDGSIGMANFHLGGPQCEPPVKKIIAGTNPWKVDAVAAGLLGFNPENIAHIAAGPEASPA